MGKKKLPDLQITELYLVKADWNRTFMAQIRREKDQDGNSVICGTVVVNEGRIWSVANTEEELGNFLDAICCLKLDYRIHSGSGITTKICDTNSFLN